MLMPNFTYSKSRSEAVCRGDDVYTRNEYAIADFVDMAHINCHFFVD